MDINQSNEEKNLPIRQLEEATSFSKYYDDKRFWRKVRRIAQKVGGSVLKPVLMLFYMMKSDSVSLKDNITPDIEMRADAKVRDLMETKA